MARVIGIIPYTKQGFAYHTVNTMAADDLLTQGAPFTVMV